MVNFVKFLKCIIGLCYTIFFLFITTSILELTKAIIRLDRQADSGAA